MKVALAILTLTTLGGLSWGLVQIVHRRANTIYPNQTELYPVIRGRVGQAVYYHDPNRAPTPTTVYASGPDKPSVQVIYVTARGYEGEQTQITTQAQAVIFAHP